MILLTEGIVYQNVNVNYVVFLQKDRSGNVEPDFFFFDYFI